MSALRQSVDDYLTVRRALGYKLTIHGRVLPQFVEVSRTAGRVGDHHQPGARMGHPAS